MTDDNAADESFFGSNDFFDTFDVEETRNPDAAAHAELRGVCQAQRAAYIELFAAGPGDTARGPAGHPLVRMAPHLTTEDVARRTLKKHQTELLKSLEYPFELLGPRNGHDVDELFAGIHAQAPWMREVVTFIWKNMQRTVCDKPWLTFEPILLTGAPGCGKSYLAQIIAETAKMPFLRMNGGDQTAVFSLTGLEAGWAGSDVGLPLKTMIDHKCANPVVLFDEVDKAARTTGYGSEQRAASGGDPTDALLALLDPNCHKSWIDKSLNVPVFVGGINWILTANDLERIPLPLRDRCRVFHITTPQGNDLHEFIAKIAYDLDPEIQHILANKIHNGTSLRSLVRIVDDLRKIERDPILH